MGRVAWVPVTSASSSFVHTWVGCPRRALRVEAGAGWGQGRSRGGEACWVGGGGDCSLAALTPFISPQAPLSNPQSLKPQ